ncbi:MAG: hypothetical protein A2341_03925 [Deltaproteobacteria bacterium RIFOXYB12_FULL_58_9]|nr:MAG: hypothetical protein A2341_03925 [Deltaproteobacteria bacterium RIFOXYB12_FULL_58_9]
MEAEHEREAERIRQNIFRRMTPAEKVAASDRLYWSARTLKKAGLRTAHPDWSEKQVEAATRLAFMRART